MPLYDFSSRDRKEKLQKIEAARRAWACKMRLKNPDNQILMIPQTLLEGIPGVDHHLYDPKRKNQRVRWEGKKLVHEQTSTVLIEIA